MYRPLPSHFLSLAIVADSGDTLTAFQSILPKYDHEIVMVVIVKFAVMIRALAIVLAAAIVSHASATGCHPSYLLGTPYAIGEWASASVTTVTSISSVACSPPGVGDCPASGVKTEGGFSSSEMYNFQCISEKNMCSNDEYAPGSLNSDLAWKRESTPCSWVRQMRNEVLISHALFAS
jgi:hypothetical protein